MAIKPFFIDKYPVTNAQFKQFLDATHYAPRIQSTSCVTGKTAPIPQGWDNRPVTWVSLEDARAYAHGPASACRTNGNGSLPRKVPTARPTHGADNWEPANVPSSRHWPHHARSRPGRCASRRVPVLTA